jgi:hypothetical protein
VRRHVAPERPDATFAGYVIWIGDAAHVPTPMTGSGFCASLHDAEALAAAIAAHGPGRMATEALQDYERDQLHSARSLVQIRTGLQPLLRPTRRLTRRSRHRRHFSVSQTKGSERPRIENSCRAVRFGGEDCSSGKNGPGRCHFQKSSAHAPAEFRVVQTSMDTEVFEVPCAELHSAS